MENDLYTNVGMDMESRNWFRASSADRMTSQEGTTSSPLLLHSIDFNNRQQQNQRSVYYRSMLVEPSNNNNMFHHLHQDAHALSYSGPSLLHPLEMAANYQVPNDSGVLPFALEGGYGGFESSCSPELVSCYNIDCGVELSTENPPPCSRISNKLCLSLATSQNSEQICSNRNELSLYRGGRFSQVVSGSKYLNVVQEILGQIASCSLENLDTPSYSITSGASAQTSWHHPAAEQGVQAFEIQPPDPALQKQALQAKKVQLLSLLQMVDNRYNQCVDEIHTIVSAFHAATELDPQIHTRFALQTISFMYKDLKGRISNQILVMGPDYSCNDLEKQWSLGQQLKKKEHQFWRPQRGLPERSVAVLRAWMFHNFLHPYPKDAEKHLLAVKSGLTRSQVSNWFINARVRVWKPMIEEMYAEMNRRKGPSGTTTTNSSSNLTTSQISIRNPILVPAPPAL